VVTHVVASGSGDAVAEWAVAGLARLLRAEVIHVTTAELADSPRWTQHIGPSGKVTSTLQLRDGRMLDSAQVNVVYNRIVLPPRPPLARVVAEDRTFALAELQACTLSWLASIGRRVLNAPHPAALGNDWRTPEEWTALALQAGLPAWSPTHGEVGRHRRQHALVIGDRVVGPPVAHRQADGLVTLRGLSGVDVLGLDLVDRAGPWSVAAVTAVPDLRRGGRRALDALAALFRRATSRETSP
jgi:hypothetical protein